MCKVKFKKNAILSAMALFPWLVTKKFTEENYSHKCASFFLIFSKGSNFVGVIFFGTFFCHQHGKSAVADKIAFFFELTKAGFTVLKDPHFL